MTNSDVYSALRDLADGVDRLNRTVGDLRDKNEHQCERIEALEARVEELEKEVRVASFIATTQSDVISSLRYRIATLENDSERRAMPPESGAEEAGNEPEDQRLPEEHAVGVQVKVTRNDKWFGRTGRIISSHGRSWNVRLDPAGSGRSLKPTVTIYKLPKYLEIIGWAPRVS